MIRIFDAYFTIHALIAEGDVPSDPTANEAIIFQSPPSAGRATFATFKKEKSRFHFNPRPPCGGRPYTITEAELTTLVSIHALIAEGDV